jgi:DNA primase
LGARLDAVLALATVFDVLQLASVEPPRSARDAIRCPLPDHFDGTPSFSIQASGRGFRCHGCGARGGVLDLAAALGLAGDRAAAVDVLAEFYRVPADDASPSEIRNARAARRRDRALASLRYESATRPSETDNAERDAQLATFRRQARGLVPILDARAAPGADYLRRRGIEPDLADAAPVRYASRWFGRAAVVFPIRDRAGRIVAGQGRYIDGDAPKTRTAGPKRGVFATPGALDADVLAIVEAPLCALSLAGCGLPSIAILGTSFAEWLPVVLGFRRRFVAILTDADAAGDAAAGKLEAALLPFGLKTERVRLDAAKDPNALLQRDADALLELASDIGRRGRARLAGPSAPSLDDEKSANKALGRIFADSPLLQVGRIG